MSAEQMPQFHVLLEDDGERIAIAANTTFRDEDAAVQSAVESAFLIAQERFAEGCDHQMIICELVEVETRSYRRITVSVEVDRNA